MNVEEAKAWIRGDRSTWNQHANQAPNQGENFANCARDDAAMIEQAYWVLRAHREGLMEFDT